MIHSPAEVAKNYVGIGKKKTETAVSKMFVLGILAGAFIALAAVAANTASCTIGNPSLAKLIAAVVFPAGLAMVLIAGAELFTGDCLIFISVLEKETTLRKMLKCWVVVYLGNLVGSLLIAYLVNAGNQLGLFSNALAVTTIKTATAKASLTFGNAFILGILCNFLVCIAVWNSLAGESLTDKVVGVFFPLLLFVVSGFEHSVANMYYVPAGLLALGNGSYAAAATQAGVNFSGLTWQHFLLNNLLPVTLGNIVGGSLLVGAVYWFTYLKKEKQTQAKGGISVMEKDAEKNMLRRIVRDKIDILTKAYCKAADEKICNTVISLEEYQQAKTVFCFVGRAEEINTQPILKDAWQAGKRVVVPRCTTKGLMQAYEIKSMRDLSPGKYGILEPQQPCELVEAEEIQFGIIPCVSCDLQGHRLGHGGGYYDRYLKNTKCPTVVICRHDTLCDSVPSEEHDVTVDMVVTEKTICKVKK